MLLPSGQDNARHTVYLIGLPKEDTFWVTMRLRLVFVVQLGIPPAGFLLRLYRGLRSRCSLTFFLEEQRGRVQTMSTPPKTDNYLMVQVIKTLKKHLHLLRLTHTKFPTVSVIIIFRIEQKRPNDLPRVHYPTDGEKRRETTHGITPYESVSLSSWCHQESNRGHKDFQSFALPTELWHQLLNCECKGSDNLCNWQIFSAFSLIFSRHLPVIQIFAVPLHRI